MPRHDIVPLQRGVPRLLTQPGVAVTSLTFQNKGQAPMWVLATVGETSPSADTIRELGFEYPACDGEAGPLADVFMGIVGANRLYGLTDGLTGAVLVSHA